MVETVVNSILSKLFTGSLLSDFNAVETINLVTNTGVIGGSTGKKNVVADDEYPCKAIIKNLSLESQITIRTGIPNLKKGQIIKVTIYEDGTLPSEINSDYWIVFNTIRYDIFQAVPKFIDPNKVLLWNIHAVG